MSFTLKILNSEGKVLKEAAGDKRADLVYEAEYAPGDVITLSLSEYPAFIKLRFDETLGDSINYITGPVTFEIPFGEKKTSYSPVSFTGSRHYLSVRYAYEFEYGAYRNLSLNQNDSHGSDTLFPHAHANVETRGEAV
ncbi:MAG: carbohydrate-binding protein, partial [Lachnospiraceae bacterium]|nr:carbohydrate-binding protein [Lachnospiraceae bacterium]